MKKFLTAFFLAGLCWFTAGLQAEADTIYDSPYVTFSPDGKAWTTCAGDTDYTHYDSGFVVSTGIQSTLRALQTGEHYYGYERVGTIPLSKWSADLPVGRCTHNNYPDGPYHGIAYGRAKCMNYYYSGWTPFCADCGQPAMSMCFYMSREAAATIDYLDMGTGLDYYYLCPHCTNLEQGAGLAAHICREISWNQYRVVYDVNTDNTYGGYMAPSFHMYNNADSYEGETVTPVTGLTRNTYRRTGYVFLGWNTEADGNGQFYEDGAEILNLTDQDYYQDNAAGTVILYAQWRKAESTLRIDPAAGSYQGHTEMVRVTQEYGSTYELKQEHLRAPAGATLSFDTDGGAAVPSIEGTMHFAGWSQVSPFGGRLVENLYYFTAEDGNVDTIRALYEPDVITLPGAEKENQSFGGWYYDQEFRQPAGGEGDTIIISEDTTLYARWVELALYAKNNYQDNQRKGAVDLRWTQPDGQGKIYKLYQSRDASSWTQVDDSHNTGTQYGARESFACTQQIQTYTVPYTGVYTLTANGAQGGSYGSYSGGKGGQVTASFWLTQGEVLTCKVGGQGGYNGGGSGRKFAGGGGYTVVSSNLKGDLLYAGGGGGASGMGNGGQGGSAQSVTTGHGGQTGDAGGGGGYQGGNAGELVLHSHTAACYQDMSGSLLSRYNVVTTREISYFYRGDEVDEGARRTMTLGSRTAPIPVNSGATLRISARYMYYYANTADLHHDAVGSGLRVYDQNGRLLLSKNGNDSVHSYEGNSFYGTNTHTFNVEVSFPQGTTGMYIVFIANTSRHWDDPYVYMDVAELKNMKQKICGYEEGEVISSKPAYGGSSWVNGEACLSYTMQAGQNTGDGSFLIESADVGYLEEMELPGLPAPDLAAPYAVAQTSFDMVGVKNGENREIFISWQEPEDRGTLYYHQAESYRASTGRRLSISNITENLLKTGVQGYYWLVDENSDTEVTKSSGAFVQEPAVTVEAEFQMRYLHLAAVDGAGNLSETVHLLLDGREVIWPLYTRALQVEEGEHVYYDQEQEKYYVRDDGATPFALEFQGGLEGQASEKYQPNHFIFETTAQGESGRKIISAPSEELRSTDFVVAAEQLYLDTQGSSCLKFHGIPTVIRRNQNAEVEVRQEFLPAGDMSGVEIFILPVAGADAQTETVYSDYQLDRQNGIVMIPDGEGPLISGMDALEGVTEIDRSQGVIRLNISAEDELSGIRDFYIKAVNEDNHQEAVFRPDENGEIWLDLGSGGEVFTGAFSLMAWAVDNVGNVTQVSHRATEFALETKVERILEPHDPVFKQGESGILSITATGYVDRVEVEFPEELLEGNSHLELIYDYTDCREYRKEEQLQFMIPLDAPENAVYKITVRVYKGNSRLEDYPSLAVMEVRGSILDELRTRLR